MSRKLIFIIIACAALAASLFVSAQLMFPDVVPDAVRETGIVSWHRQAAFLITATAWISAELAVVFSIVLAAYLWRPRSAKTSRSQ
ncbi:hypothetical protein [Bradyrhizobium sp. STM 3557]|uniref:hypothetical protein n=1 Tax=Bradyrhizobium sp. STM 3557 TaxID=578920 RepID=UPI003890BCDF